MKKKVRLATIIALLSVPLSSHTIKKIETPIQVVEEDPFDAMKKMEFEWLTKDLHELFNVYYKNDVNELRKFGHSLVYYNFPKYHFDLVFNNFEGEELKTNAFFVLFNFLSDHLFKLPGNIYGWEEEAKKGELSELVFNEQIQIYYAHRDLLNKEYALYTEPPAQKQSIFYKHLAEKITEMNAAKKPEASLKLFEVLKDHFKDTYKTNDFNTLNYADAFNVVLNNIPDKNSIRDSEFNKKLSDFILNFFTGKKRSLGYVGSHFTNVLFECATMSNSDETKIHAYTLFKELVLSRQYNGRYINDCFQDANQDYFEYFFHDFNNTCTNAIKQTINLLSQTSLDKNKESLELQQTISEHVRRNLDYLPKMSKPGFIKDAISNLYSTIIFMNESETKKAFNKRIDRYFSNFVVHKIAKGGVYITTKSAKEFFTHARNVSGIEVLDGLIERLKNNYLDREKELKINRFLYLMGLINTEKSVKEFFNEINSSIQVDKKVYPVISLLYEDDIKELTDYFDYSLLVPHLDSQQNSSLKRALQETLESKILASQDFNESNKIIESSLNCNNLFFLKYMRDHWKDTESGLAERTINLLEQKHLPSAPDVYVDWLKYLPTDYAVEKLKILYYAGNSNEANQYTQSYDKMYTVFGDEGYFFLVKKIINTLKEINTSNSLELIRDISETKDEDQQVKDYAKKVLE